MTTLRAGTFRVTTAPAPTNASSPISTPGQRIAPPPTRAPRRIVGPRLRDLEHRRVRSNQLPEGQRIWRIARLVDHDDMPQGGQGRSDFPDAFKAERVGDDCRGAGYPQPVFKSLDAEQQGKRQGNRTKLIDRDMGDHRFKTLRQKKPNPIDIHVGSRIRLRRTMLGMSQEKLGESLGITFQQIQKYEKGTNRVGASRLQAISGILNVPVSFFFEDAPDGNPANTPAGMAEASSSNYVVDFLSSSEGLQLNRSFVKISDPKVRRKIVDLVKALAAEADSE